jgi:hypothetical protein
MEPKNKTQKNQFSTLIKMSFFVVLIWLISGVIIYYSAENWSDRGAVGDLFGAVNALFSGLAFAALIYTIILQREEIRLNRSEIELNRKELKKSVVVQQSSQKALREQVTQTHLTAKINAMSTVINYYNTQVSNVNNSPELIDKARTKRRELIKQMDDLIDGMQDSEIE